jgi:hypothetical protein
MSDPLRAAQQQQQQGKEQRWHERGGGKGTEADAQPRTVISALLVLRTLPVWSLLPLAVLFQDPKPQALTQAVAHLDHEGGVPLPILRRLGSALDHMYQETHLHTQQVDEE